jgi:hypothetical protein
MFRRESQLPSRRDLFSKDGFFGPKLQKKAGIGPMNPQTWLCAGGCRGDLWAMIMARLPPVSPGQAAVRGSRGGGRVPKAHHGSLNRTTSPRD